MGSQSKAGRTLPTARIAKKADRTKAIVPNAVHQKRTRDRLKGSRFVSDDVD